MFRATIFIRERMVQMSAVYEGSTRVRLLSQHDLVSLCRDRRRVVGLEHLGARSLRCGDGVQMTFEWLKDGCTVNLHFYTPSFRIYQVHHESS